MREASQPYLEKLAECLAVPQRTHHSRVCRQTTGGGLPVEHSGNVLGEHPCLTPGVLRMAWGTLAVRSGMAAQSPSAQTSGGS